MVDTTTGDETRLYCVDFRIDPHVVPNGNGKCYIAEPGTVKSHNCQAITCHEFDHDNIQYMQVSYMYITKGRTHHTETLISLHC